MKKLMMLGLVLGLVAVSQATLIDFGIGGAVLTDWTGLDGIEQNTSSTVSVTEDSTTVSMTANRWKDRYALDGGDFMDLNDLLYDFAGPVGDPTKAPTDATLSLALAAGTYDITLYHHDSKLEASLEAWLTLEDADGERATETLTASFGTEPTTATLSTYTTTVTSNGVDDVTFYYDNSDADTLGAFPINGMSIVLVPEPTEPNNPTPLDGGATGPPGDVLLSWTNLDPNTDDSDNTYVDVWFGTDEENLGLASEGMIVDTIDGVTSITVNAPAVGTYYWLVNSYLNGDPGSIDYDIDPDDPTMAEGQVWVFTVYSTKCQADKASGMELNKSDVNGDCITDLLDVAIFASEWLYNVEL